MRGLDKWGLELLRHGNTSTRMHQIHSPHSFPHLLDAVSVVDVDVDVEHPGMLLKRGEPRGGEQG